MGDTKFRVYAGADRAGARADADGADPVQEVRADHADGGRAEPIQEEETLDNEKEVVNPEVVPEVRAASCQL